MPTKNTGHRKGREFAVAPEDAQPALDRFESLLRDVLKTAKTPLAAPRPTTSNRKHRQRLK